MKEIINLTNMSDNDLVVLKGLIDKEMFKRKNEEREKLINNFKKALCELWEAGISVEYYCDALETESLSDWDCFKFD